MNGEMQPWRWTLLGAQRYRGPTLAKLDATRLKSPTESLQNSSDCNIQGIVDFRVLDCTKFYQKTRQAPQKNCADPDQNFDDRVKDFVLRMLTEAVDSRGGIHPTTIDRHCEPHGMGKSHSD
jgi:hypothetical protein